MRRQKEREEQCWSYSPVLPSAPWRAVARNEANKIKGGNSCCFKWLIKGSNSNRKINKVHDAEWKAMKSGVKTGTIVFNRRNHGTNNNCVLFIIKTNKMLPLEVTDPNNLECWRIITSIHSVFLKVSSMLVVYYQYKESDTCWEEKSPQNYNVNYVFGSM